MKEHVESQINPQTRGDGGGISGRVRGGGWPVLARVLSEWSIAWFHPLSDVQSRFVRAAGSTSRSLGFHSGFDPLSHLGSTSWTLVPPVTQLGGPETRCQQHPVGFLPLLGLAPAIQHPAPRVLVTWRRRRG